MTPEPNQPAERSQDGPNGPHTPHAGRAGNTPKHWLTTAGVLLVLLFLFLGGYIWLSPAFSGEGHGWAQVCAQGGIRQPAVFCAEKPPSCAKGACRWLAPAAAWEYVSPAAPVPKVGDTITSASPVRPRHGCVGQADDTDQGRAEHVAWDAGACGYHPTPMN